MKVAIVGSRDYPDWSSIRQFVRDLGPDVEVVSGGARGVDTIAEQEARACGMVVTVFPADWEFHGRRAGYLRNHTIVDYADVVVAFWDGQSRGTAHTIDIARKAGKLGFIYTP